MTDPRAGRSRRILVPAALATLGCAALLGRVVYIQVYQHDVLSAEAQAELEVDNTLYARRGAILDRNGDVMATSVATWDLYIRAKDWTLPADAVEGSTALAAALRLDASQLREKVAAVGTGDVKIATDVDYDTGKALIDAKVKGLEALGNTKRVKPNGDIGASIIGLLGYDNHGIAGIESSLNRVLAGLPGRVFFERDTTGDPIPYAQHVTHDPEPGKDIVLTIDRVLQEMAEDTLADAVSKHRAKGGTVIMMDPYTGDILALATSPSLKYSTLDLDDSGQLALLKNAAVTDLYEPGSVMKVVTAAAAIDAGVVTANTWYHDSGSVKIGTDTELKNFDNGSYGDQTMTGVLQHSINTGAVFMAQKLGASAFTRYMERFGFGSTTGIELSGEPEAIFRHPEDEGWTEVDLATQAFGQAISVTPVQMATAFAAVINGGNLVEPRLVRATIDSEGRRDDIPVKVRGQAISAATSATLRGMLKDVVDPPDGSYYHPGNPRDYTAGGKSGTANIPVPNGYNETQIASFIGFAPAESPRLLIMVKLDNNADLLTGTAAAAPVFADLVDRALAYLKVRPDTGDLVARP